MSDYYETLGVAKDAKPEDIKKAYRKLASKHHPDKGGDTKKFQDVQIAYDTLSDENKRAEYNMQQDGGFGGQGGSSHWSFRARQGTGFAGMGDIDESDIFEHIRRQFTQGGPRRPQKPMNRDVRIGMQLKMVDTLEEHEKIIKVNLPGRPQEEIKIKIPRGVYHGAQIRYPGLGDHSVSEAPRGDLYVQFLVETPENFEQIGIDLITVIPVSCIEAMVGVEKDVEGIDGKKFKIVIPPGAQYGSKFAIPSQGLYSTDTPGRGRLIVAIDVYIPTLLTPEQIEELKKIQATQEEQ